MARERKKAVKKEVEPDPATLLQVKIAEDTKLWTRNAADEKAVAAGMVFEASRGEYVCDWIESNCYLYEGQGAGKPMVLMPYQRDFIMRLFSWVYFAPEWNEYIRRFRKANLLAPKKSGKSPLLAALGAYLMIADGESGQKVYAAAKNGKQAQITQQHAIAMVEQSPVLREECQINRAHYSITHTSTRSKMMILAGDDTRGAQANEGINGSVFIDELHVFDREMHERTSRAGISRKEPINLAVSTAGDDPSSYGYERIEQGRRVNEGKSNDLQTLHVEYMAPQKITDEDIANNLNEYITQANPALGYTVKWTEILNDYEQSKDKPREMARFKQYRLNIWIGSVSPWLSARNWELNARKYTLHDMRGMDCRLGLDLSRTRDMTGATLTFEMPDLGPDKLRVWPLFWLPRKTAELRRMLFPYLDWAEAGEIFLTEGNVVDFHAVENDICAEIEEYGLTVTCIFFDQHYAEELTQRLMERLNCTRTAVSQSLMALSPLCKELERRIDSGNLEHPDNAVLNWQAGHVQVWSDRNQNVRPVKPDSNSGKSIDGIMSLIDTLAGVVEYEGGMDTIGVSSL